MAKQSPRLAVWKIIVMTAGFVVVVTLSLQQRMSSAAPSKGALPYLLKNVLGTEPSQGPNVRPPSHWPPNVIPQLTRAFYACAGFSTLGSVLANMSSGTQQQPQACELQFKQYVPSIWEAQWFDQREALASSICKSLLQQADLTTRWVKGLQPLLAGPNGTDQDDIVKGLCRMLHLRFLSNARAVSSPVTASMITAAPGVVGGEGVGGRGKGGAICHTCFCAATAQLYLPAGQVHESPDVTLAALWAEGAHTLCRCHACHGP